MTTQAFCSLGTNSLQHFCSKNRLAKEEFGYEKFGKNREAHGHYHNLINEMRLQDLDMHFNYLRMDAETFDSLLHLVGPFIQKKSTNMREAIPAGMKLAVTLRYLATGDSQAFLQL